jgi:hypothetical protein
LHALNIKGGCFATKSLPFFFLYLFKKRGKEWRLLCNKGEGGCFATKEREVALQQRDKGVSFGEGNIKTEKDIVHITSNTEDKEYYSFKFKKDII